MTRKFFLPNGRIEGPGSTTLAYQLEGPLGAQDLADVQSAHPAPEPETLPAVEMAHTEPPPASGVSCPVRPL